MNKSLVTRICLICAVALLAALFVTFLLLSVPLGGRASVLPTTVFYVVGGVIAGIFLAAATVFFVRSRKVG